jgi:hypothetical protein
MRSPIEAANASQPPRLPLSMPRPRPRRELQETSLSRRALRESSSAIAIVGCNRWRTVAGELQSRGCESSAAEPNVRKPRDDTRDNAVAIKPDRNLRLVPRICGKDEALDPFDAAAQKFDSDIIHFLPARIHPSFWEARLHSCPRRDLDYEAFEIVKGCMGDKALLYSLVACTAVFMERAELGVCKTKTQSSVFYLQNALVAIREQVQCKAKESSAGSDVLQSIALMVACADFLEDYAATLAHLRAMKYPIEQRGGFAAVESRILRTIIRADVSRAVATLESSVMSSPTKPTTIALPKGTCDAELERQSEDALLLTARAEIPKQMAEHASHLIQCIRMLDYGWTHPDASGRLIGKFLSTAVATLYYLLVGLTSLTARFRSGRCEEAGSHENHAPAVDVALHDVRMGSPATTPSSELPIQR